MDKPSLSISCTAKSFNPRSYPITWTWSIKLIRKKKKTINVWLKIIKNSRTMSQPDHHIIIILKSLIILVCWCCKYITYSWGLKLKMIFAHIKLWLLHQILILIVSKGYLWAMAFDRRNRLLLFFQSKYIFEDLIGRRYVVIWWGETTDLTIFRS